MGRRKVFEEYAKNVTMKLYSWEKEPVKQFIKRLREEKLKSLHDTI